MARKPEGKKPGGTNGAGLAAARGYQDILYEVKDQVAWVTINRPRVLNAFREQSLDARHDLAAVTASYEAPPGPAAPARHPEPGTRPRPSRPGSRCTTEPQRRSRG